MKDRDLINNELLELAGYYKFACSLLRLLVCKYLMAHAPGGK